MAGSPHPTRRNETILCSDESKGLSVFAGAVQEGARTLRTAQGKTTRVWKVLQMFAKMIDLFFSWMTKLIDVIFGCRHSRYSFPVTIRGSARRPQAGALTGTYVACLDCGREFPYDWQEMRVITSQSERREYVASLATKQVA